MRIGEGERINGHDALCIAIGRGIWDGWHLMLSQDGTVWEFPPDSANGSHLGKISFGLIPPHLLSGDASEDTYDDWASSIRLIVRHAGIRSVCLRLENEVVA